MADGQVHVENTSILYCLSVLKSFSGIFLHMHKLLNMNNIGHDPSEGRGKVLILFNMRTILL
jgi:hypothetical protein